MNHNKERKEMSDIKDFLETKRFEDYVFYEVKGINRDRTFFDLHDAIKYYELVVADTLSLNEIQGIECEIVMADLRENERRAFIVPKDSAYAIDTISLSVCHKRVMTN